MEPAKDTIRRISPQSGRRRFLKQLAAGLALGAQAFPAVAEEKPERPRQRQPAIRSRSPKRSRAMRPG
ncbi:MULTISPECIES: hypothetical protein [Bradyrhizobium]|jgi:hypothetical protein|uniref:Twin-arginine translocation signal domain-containing protein n=2 Tax=Bradyrhizobium TaxID=374 RepID=A0ABY0QCZ5_9BRAD|nr:MULTISPECIES: hypothetical protein [Bradyrhizobium]SDJ94014.1 hypothetical protein SAMN05444163_6811 [Bradyrhizobium ottawaense]SEB96856.1 hypothetical protein SAMN05444171_0346 [Bradyrhizobium lablabi]SHM65718.1 hypothetical protein SAMN05444321_7125 [Bradyrhizobium lablabi]